MVIMMKMQTVIFEKPPHISVLKGFSGYTTFCFIVESIDLHDSGARKASGRLKELGVTCTVFFRNRTLHRVPRQADLKS